MKTLSKFLVLSVFCLMLAGFASADVFNITADNGSPGCTSGNSCGTVTVTLNSGTIHFDIELLGNYGIFGNKDAFGFNVAGSTTGLTMSNFSDSSFTGAGGSGNEDGWGGFAFRVDGPPGNNLVQSLTFDVTRTGGFSSTADVEVGANGSNGSGFTQFAMHLKDFGSANGNTGYAGVVPGTPQVPEPASLMLVGSGLGLLASRLRRRK